MERDGAREAGPLPDDRLPRPPEEDGGSTRAAWDALGPADRLRSLEREVERLETDRQARVREELASLEADLERAQSEHARLQDEAGVSKTTLQEAETAIEQVRADRREAERAVEAARAQAAKVGADLAAVNQFMRTAAPEGSTTLAQSLDVDGGYELALAAALGPRLSAALVDDLAAGEKLLDGVGEKGGTALMSAGGSRPRTPAEDWPAGEGAAVRLLDHVKPEPAVADLAERLLARVWVVDSLVDLPKGFSGLAVTRAGRRLDGATGELSQAPAGGAERVLEERRRRDELIAASERAVAEEGEAARAAEQAAEAIVAADAARDEADAAHRRASRAAAEAAEAASRTEWVISRRREAPDEGPGAVRRAELLADLRAERRLAERIEAERADRTRALERVRTGIERDTQLAADAERAATALESAHASVAARRDALVTDLEGHAAGGEQTGEILRACAHEEAELQGRLKQGSEAVTGAEVAAQQLRDGAAEIERELATIAAALGLPAEPATEPLPDEEREELGARLERLNRRREQLGPVNPLAKQEYDEAVAHVEALEEQRADLESALAELEGLIAETDRRIRESFEQTFEAAAKNFEDVVEHLFPGGRGRLRLVQSEGPRAVIAGEEPPEGGEPAADPEDEQPEAGVEIEVTPPGKSTKRLSLLSGGEKSLVALAFMFAVFLARPCPFYILDEVEAALDDINIDRFLQLVRRYSDRAQFIVVTHQKRTMDAADTLYGVSMGGDGISRVISRKLGDAGIDEVAA